MIDEIIEVLKHLAGRHDQKKHGRPDLLSVPQHLKDAWESDDEQAVAIYQIYKDTVKNTIQRANLTDEENWSYTVDKDKAWEWQELFHEQIRNQDRFYRGLSSSELFNAIENGKFLSPVAQGLEHDEFENDSDEGDPNISLSLSPQMASGYGEFILQVNGDKARQQGLFPRNYVGRFERLGGMSGIEEFEVEVPESLSLDSVEAVVYAEGNVEHYSKITENLADYRRHAASYGVAPEQTEKLIAQAITATERYNKIFKTLKDMGILVFLGDEE